MSLFGKNGERSTASDRPGVELPFEGKQRLEQEVVAPNELAPSSEADAVVVAAVGEDPRRASVVRLTGVRWFATIASTMSVAVRR